MKRNKVRTIALVIVIILTLTMSSSLLSGCKKTDDDDTLTFLAYAPENNTVKQMYEGILTAFTEQTGIKVKPIFVPKDQYNTKLKSNFMSDKNKPDVFYLDQPMLADYVDYCLCLDEGFFVADSQDGLKKSDFFSSAMDTTLYKGKCYAVPLSLTSSVLLYNKSLVNTVPTDWNSWLNTSVPSDKALFGGIGSGGYASWYFQAFLKSAGGEMISNNAPAFNSANGVAAAQMVVDLYAKSSKTIRESSNAFTNGNVMFVLAHSADIVNFYTSNPTWCAENLGATTFIPQESNGTSYSNIGGENLGIRKDSGKEEQSKQFVKFLLKEENIKKIISWNFPAIKSIATVNTVNPVTNEQIAQIVQDALAVVLSQLDTASARPAVKKWIEVNDTYLANALADILDNGTNIKEALDQAAAQASSVLDFD